MKIFSFFLIMLAFLSSYEATGQWTTSGSNIYNTNAGNVGIGSSSPTTLLHVAKNMTEPTITIQNPGGTGGATYTMIDNASGANWKFKATLTGGFKIRDHANLLDVFVIEPNSSANAIYINSAGSVGIGTATPANSALVDITSTTKAFSPPRMTQAQIGTISSPANGLLVFCTTDNKIYAFVASANTWKEILLGSGTISPQGFCGSSMTINHVAGSVAPVTKTVIYGTVTNIPGEPSKCWITSNLGADQQAIAPDDATEASAGWYWQFNRMQGYKHDGTTRTPSTTWITTINENLDWQAANDPCTLELGSDWRLPSSTEWTNVDAGGGWTNRNDTWNSALKLHAAGYLEISAGSLIARGNYGAYWSNSQYTDITRGLGLYFRSDICYVDDYNKANGFGSRCIRDISTTSCGSNFTINHVAGSVAPVTKTVTYGTVTNIPGETSKCWITSNLGSDHQATAVDDATEASAGWYWQFNRMQGYKHDGTTRTPNTTWITLIDENSDWIAANDPCAIELGSSWRLPSYTEWINVDASGNWIDWNGPWNSALKMHATGYLDYSNGSLYTRGAHGGYWSSSQGSNSSGWLLAFYSGECVMNDGGKAFGSGCRCLRD